MDIKEFQTRIKTTSNDEMLLDFCRKSVLHGTPHIFKNKEDDFYEFRKRIAEKYEISFNDIYITGSAKLGFSPYKSTTFSYDSDIDVAIVSRKLFESILNSIKVFQYELRNNRRVVTDNEIKMYHSFLEYIPIGWIRPDKLPISFNLDILKKDWFNFFKSISFGKSEVGNYKVSAGIFLSYKHLEEYIYNGIRQHKASLNLGSK